MTDFSVGDRVVLNQSYENYAPGTEGVIDSIHDGDYGLVYFIPDGAPYPVGVFGSRLDKVEQKDNPRQAVDFSDYRAEYVTEVNLPGVYRVRLEVVHESDLVDAEMMTEVLEQAFVGSMITQYSWMTKDDLRKDK